MTFIKTFKQLSKKDVKITGGKGASLGEMTQAGFPVPLGFIILTNAFEKFFKKEELPEELSSEILAAFDKLESKYVAVRSSATAEDSTIDAWAGQLESYLNITRKDLLKSIQKCWSSLYTPRALFYKKERGLAKKHISVAVIVQKMVNAEVSGVCFTVHPVTQDKNQMIIEAVFGLGESLVQGIITPDSYILKKDRLNIINKNIQDKQKLSQKQIKELAKICLQIEKHYKKPQDIEWVLEKEKFYVVQSRPITTLTK